MMTRIRSAEGSATAWQSQHEPRAWHWTRAYDKSASHGPFPSLADAIADAQRVLGPDVAITRFTDPEPKP